jgi:hypothetical protein
VRELKLEDKISHRIKAHWHLEEIFAWSSVRVSLVIVEV